VNAIPWYQSKVMIGAVVTVVSTLLGLTPKFASALGLTSPGAIQTAVDSVFQVIALIAGLYTAVTRQASPIQPLTLTQKAADAHPANTPTPVAPPSAPPPAPLPRAPLTPANVSHLDAAIDALQGKK